MTATTGSQVDDLRPLIEEDIKIIAIQTIPQKYLIEEKFVVDKQHIGKQRINKSKL